MFTPSIWNAFIFLCIVSGNSILSEYYAGEEGGVCVDDESVIRSTTECTMALKELRYQSTKINWTGTFHQIPTGCSITIDLMRPHFEISPTGVGMGRQDLTPICKNLSMTGKFCFMQYSMRSTSNLIFQALIY